MGKSPKQKFTEVKRKLRDICRNAYRYQTPCEDCGEANECAQIILDIHEIFNEGS